MKKILFLLLFTITSYGQAVFDEGIQITGNANSGTATKVNVQEANGKVNTQTINTAFNKNFGTAAGTVVEGGTLGSNAYTSTAYLPLTGGTLSGILYARQPVADLSSVGSLSQNSSSFSSIVTQQVAVSQSDENYYPMLTGINIILGQGFNNRPSFGFMRPTGTLHASGDVVIQNSGDGLPLVRWKFKGNGDFECPANVKAANYTGSATLTGTPTAPTAAAGTNTTQIATTAFVQANSTVRPYKVYTALLSQTGTNAPTAIVLENTLGGTVVWTRNAAGVYVATLTGAFTTSKTITFGTFGNVDNPSLNTLDFQRNSVDSMFLITRVSGTPTDSVMDVNTSIEIRVYN